MSVVYSHLHLLKNIPYSPFPPFLAAFFPSASATYPPSTPIPASAA